MYKLKYSTLVDVLGYIPPLLASDIKSYLYCLFSHTPFWEKLLLLQQEMKTLHVRLFPSLMILWLLQSVNKPGQDAHQIIPPVPPHVTKPGQDKQETPPDPPCVLYLPIVPYNVLPPNPVSGQSANYSRFIQGGASTSSSLTFWSI